MRCARSSRHKRTARPPRAPPALLVTRRQQLFRVQDPGLAETHRQGEPHREHTEAQHEALVERRGPRGQWRHPPRGGHRELFTDGPGTEAVGTPEIGQHEISQYGATTNRQPVTVTKTPLSESPSAYTSSRLSAVLMRMGGKHTLQRPKTTTPFA